MAELPEDITSPNRIDPTRPKEKETLGTSEDNNAFKQHMNVPSGAAKTNSPSPIDLANTQKVSSPSTPPTMESVQQQMNSVSGSLGDIKTHLHTKGLKLKHSEKLLVRKKLSNAQEHITTVSKKLGNNTESLAAKLNRSRNPVAKFLSMVSDGQHQMIKAAETLKKLNADGQSVNPAKLLLVQIKLNKAQQELNYTSVILGNATSMIKTLFNIQI